MKILVCSAWPYGYSIPHLGNLVSSLLSGDVFSRYYKMKGYDTLYVSGTDMHGTRAEFEALKEGKDVKELLEKNHEKLKELIKKYNIEFDNYTNTESEVHKEFVKEVFTKLEKNGYIFSKVEKRPFCLNDKIFLADAYIEGKCPYCGYEHAKGNQCENCGRLLEPEELIEPKCRICEKGDIEFRETKHWFFDLPKLKKELEEYVNSHPEWSDNVKNMTKQMLKDLKPRAVTRDLKWGIPAPFEGAEGKVIYVWAEAALGYVSATKEIRKDWKEFWFGKDVKQIYTIGKDNIPFHTIMFPAQLIGTKDGYHLPDQISATEYLNWEGGKKFSKSKNIGIFMDEAYKLMPADNWRFYLLYDRPENRDTEFSWSEVDKAVNQMLLGDFGNFINRTLKLIEKYYDGKVPEGKLNKEDEEVLELIKAYFDEYSSAMEKGSIREAVDTFIGLSKVGNEYIQRREPWKNEEKRGQTLYVCSQLSKALAILAYPIVPETAKKLWKMLNLEGEIKWEEYEKELESGHQFNKAEILIEKVDIEKLKEEYERLKGN